MLLGIIFLTYSFTYFVGLLTNRTLAHAGLRLTMYDLELLIILHTQVYAVLNMEPRDL